MSLANARAVEVMSVEPGTPAAGTLLAGDLVAEIAGLTVETVDDVHRELIRRPIGEALALTVVRGRERLQVNMAPIETP